MASSSTDQLNGETTVDPQEVDFFNIVADWWNENGVLRALHTYNNVRVPFLVQCLINNGVIDSAAKECESPLKGLKILDVGCGGGILTEALAKLGAEATGLDAGEDLIRIARDHALRLNKTIKIQYVHSTIEDFATSNRNKFDVIISSEVVEHVNNPQEFVSKSVECLKYGGSAFFTTISRNFLSRIVMIWLFEYVTRSIRVGTHDYQKFINPEELTEVLEQSDCEVKEIEGYMLNPFNREWFTVPSTKVNYALHAIKTLKTNVEREIVS